MATLIGESPLSIREFMAREPLPLAAIHDALLRFLCHRDDVVICGAQAVNAYVDVPRLTQDVDIASSRAAELAEEIRGYLREQLQIAVRVRVVAGGFRVYQVRREGSRHLVDIRAVHELPPARSLEGFRILAPEDLIVAKLFAAAARTGREKGYTDLRDLAALLRTFPELKTREGPIGDRLAGAGAGDRVIQLWEEWVAREVGTGPEDEDEFTG